MGHEAMPKMAKDMTLESGIHQIHRTESVMESEDMDLNPLDNSSLERLTDRK